MAIGPDTILLPFNLNNEPFDDEGNDQLPAIPNPNENEGFDWAEKIDPSTGWPVDIVGPISKYYMIDGDQWGYTDEGKIINPGGGVQGENRPYEPLFDGDMEQSPGVTPFPGARNWTTQQTLVAGPPQVDTPQITTPNLVQPGSSVYESWSAGQEDEDSVLTSDQVFQFITGILPDPSKPWETSEFLLDLWMDARFFAKGAAAGALIPDGPLMIAGELVGGLMAVAARRGMTAGAKRLWRHAIERLNGILDLGTGGMAGKVGTGFGGGFGTSYRMNKRFNLLDNPNRLTSTGKRFKSNLYQQLSDQGLLGEAENVLNKLDEFRTKKNFGGPFNPDRPTTGFKGNRTVKYIDSAGNASEIGWRWSHTAGDYIPYDVTKRLELVSRRNNWNINRSSRSAKYANEIFGGAKKQNAAVKEALENLRKENPEYFWKIMGENYDKTKGIVYVEHINPQRSPVWVKQPDGSFRHRVSGIAPRDAGNLVIVPGPEMGILKTKIESILYAPKRLQKIKDAGGTGGIYLDFDRKRRVLVLRNANGRRIRDISSLTNVDDASVKSAINKALAGHQITPGIAGEQIEVLDAAPKVPPHLDALDGISNWPGRF